LLAPETVRLGRRLLRRGTDSAAGTPMAYGAGFELYTELGLLGPATDVFGHAGAGGSRHGAWPADRVGFSYAMNEIRAEFPDRRPLGLLAALHDAVRRRNP
jgi:CubicO group peptidase (beta-lactamase class C family)